MPHQLLTEHEHFPWGHTSNDFLVWSFEFLFIGQGIWNTNRNATKNPNPYTCNSKPFTLNPHHRALNCKPQTTAHLTLHT